MPEWVEGVAVPYRGRTAMTPLRFGTLFSSGRMVTTAARISLSEFLAVYDSQGHYELFDGIVTEKMSPKRFHSKTQRALLYLLDERRLCRGRCGAIGRSRMGWI